MAEPTLEEIIGGEKETSTSSKGEKEPENKETKSPEELKKEEHLANINKAIEEANEELRKKRKQVKQPVLEEEELPKIDFKDPSAQAWKKEINDTFSPLSAENDKEKDEVRNYALQEFLADKPALAKNTEMLKRVMATYDTLKEGKISEKNVDIVISYLEKAYAAENREEILAQQRREKLSKARADEAFSGPAVSRGATAYSGERSTTRKFSKEELDALAILRITPEQQIEYEKAQANKSV